MVSKKLQSKSMCIDTTIKQLKVIEDMAITSLKSIFEQLKTFESIFGFLFDSNKLKSLDGKELRECCATFHSTFSRGDSSYVDLNNLFSEFKVLLFILPNELMLATEILEFIAIRMFQLLIDFFLTVLMTVASAERSISKLKLIKTYLRSSMSQERLNGLTILSIENDFWKKFILMLLLMILHLRMLVEPIFYVDDIGVD
ncbi:zinc finger MYM-type protein 1-like [Gossypium australe]|uniref:Zinc finger MYM-type protein 1-like n=1 Tax=Gossypium australe TaxID=47621 RepID=A0A5B6WHK5_9ROSI|nr:zinc finger MYM-type protein 1-like [Gossypium australe]